jgi:hypothetical protein
MFYPTGKNTKGRCLVCANDESRNLDEKISGCKQENMVESICEWLDENNYCMEKWQLKKYLESKGCQSCSKLDEDMDGGGAPGPGFSTLGTVNGMGNPATPTNDGTNSGFYNPSMTGSGDKFTSISPSGKKARKKKLLNFLNFVSKNNKK